jgi:hypothetical protein
LHHTLHKVRALAGGQVRTFCLLAVEGWPDYLVGSIKDLTPAGPHSMLDSIMSIFVPVHREGYRFIAIFAAITLVLFWLLPDFLAGSAFFSHCGVPTSSAIRRG